MIGQRARATTRLYASRRTHRFPSVRFGLMARRGQEQFDLCSAQRPIIVGRLQRPPYVLGKLRRKPLSDAASHPQRVTCIGCLVEHLASHRPVGTVPIGGPQKGCDCAVDIFGRGRCHAEPIVVDASVEIIADDSSALCTVAHISRREPSAGGVFVSGLTGFIFSRFRS